MKTTVFAALLGSAFWAAAVPIRLHPVNPHYFEFNGKPTVLISSTEHYGAVLNLDFDYIAYLDELQARGFNLTRASSGTYCEPAGFFLTPNSLCPAPGRFISPWARSDEPGYFNGGNKFDLTKWDEAFFARLKDFVGQAAARDIVVELVLFFPMYRADMWQLCPMNAANNINGIGDFSDAQVEANNRMVYTIYNEPLLAVQEAVVRKMVHELQPYDNVYFEVVNEPYYGANLSWQEYITEVIVDEESGAAQQHLIAQNVANESATITDLNPAVSVVNFHYALPSAVDLNYDLNKVIANDENGFHGNADFTYRREGWEFIIAGGAVYDNLDSTFNHVTPDGSGNREDNNLCGGGAALRQQLGVLKSFMEGFDFIRMVPRTNVVADGRHALVDEGRAYAIYLESAGVTNVGVTLPAGEYRADWVDTTTGGTAQSETFVHGGGVRNLVPPAYDEDLALAIRLTDPDLDADGIADAWEIQYFQGTSIVNGGPNDDWDVDGHDNSEEFNAGTDPTDPLSLLKVTDLSFLGNDRIIQWNSASNRTYSVEWSGSMDGPWSTVAGRIPATPPVNSFTNQLPGGSMGYFRIKLD